MAISDARPGLEPVEARALHQRVADQLRTAIVSGDIAAGTWLREMDLAERLGVSRGPVREALRALERDGLIESYPYRGVRVLDVDVAEAIELFTPLRQTVEGFAVRKLLEGAACPDGRSRLEAVLDRMEAAIATQRAAAARGDRHGVAGADLAFHRALCCQSGVPLVTQLWLLVEARVELIFNARYAVSDPEGPVDFGSLGETHLRIVAALRAGDAATVPLLREHIATGMARASARIRERAPA